MSTDSGFLEVDRGSLHWQTAGAGDPVVFVHAGIADLRMWDEQVAVLQETYRCIRYDVRGYGQSPNPAGTYRDDLQLAALLDSLDVGQATLVGASNGGRISIELAISNPTRVKRLVVIGSSVSGVEPDPEIQRQWKAIEDAHAAGDIAQAIELTLRMWVDGPQRSPDQVDPGVRTRVSEMLQHLYTIPEELDAGEQLPFEPPAIERLGEIRAPALVVIGEDDFAEKKRLAARLVSDLANARKVSIPLVAHLPNMERPDEINQLLLEFLAEG